MQDIHWLKDSHLLVLGPGLLESYDRGRHASHADVGLAAHLSQLLTSFTDATVTSQYQHCMQGGPWSHQVNSSRDLTLICVWRLIWQIKQKWCKKTENISKHWHIGTHMRVLSESFLKNTNITRFRWFSKSLHPCALDESSLSIGRVKCRLSEAWENLAPP